MLILRRDVCTLKQCMAEILVSVRKDKLENNKVCEDSVRFVEKRLDIQQRKYLSYIATQGAKVYTCTLLVSIAAKRLTSVLTRRLYYLPAAQREST